MNLNINIEDELSHSLSNLSHITGLSQEIIVTSALKEWMKKNEHRRWSKEIIRFKGEKDFPPFENERENVVLEKDDPFL